MENQKWSEKAASGLRNAADELEQFALKYNLGRMEAASFFQKAKKKYREYLTSFSSRIQRAKSLSKKVKDSLRQNMSRLRSSIEKEENGEGGGSVLHALRRLRQQLKKNKSANEFVSEIDAEIQKLQIKIKILRLKAEEQKILTGQKLKVRRALIKKRMIKFRERFYKMNVTNSRNQIQKQLITGWKRLKKVFA